MFTNLRTALFQKGISMKQYAGFLGAGGKTVQSKVKGMTDFSYLEFKNCSLLLPEYNADYLFTECQSENRPA